MDEKPGWVRVCLVGCMVTMKKRDLALARSLLGKYLNICLMRKLVLLGGVASYFYPLIPSYVE